MPLPRLKLVTFADGSLAYRIAAMRFKREAEQAGIFSEVSIYNRRKLLKITGLKGSNYVQLLRRANRGFGYWAWKPLLIDFELSECNAEFDYLIYADIGCTLNINKESLGRLQDYLHIAKTNGVMTFHLPGFVEKYWSKRDSLDYFNLAHTDLESFQRLAGILVFANSEQAARLSLNWRTACEYNNFALLEDPDQSKEPIGFRAHRHDQSIWSQVSKSAQIPSIPDETFHKDNWSTAGHKYPIWATRLTGASTLANNSKFFFRVLDKILKLIP